MKSTSALPLILMSALLAVLILPAPAAFTETAAGPVGGHTLKEVILAGITECKTAVSTDRVTLRACLKGKIVAFFQTRTHRKELPEQPPSQRHRPRRRRLPHKAVISRR